MKSVIFLKKLITIIKHCGTRVKQRINITLKQINSRLERDVSYVNSTLENYFTQYQARKATFYSLRHQKVNIHVSEKLKFSFPGKFCTA
jgi:hypothetical protein